MALVGVRPGIGRRRSSLEGARTSLTSKRLVIVISHIDQQIRCSRMAGGRFLSQASCRCFDFLHIDVTSAVGLLLLRLVCGLGGRCGWFRMVVGQSVQQTGLIGAAGPVSVSAKRHRLPWRRDTTGRAVGSWKGGFEALGS
jgi:hypothetical protein